MPAASVRYSYLFAYMPAVFVEVCLQFRRLSCLQRVDYQLHTTSDAQLNASSLIFGDIQIYIFACTPAVFDGEFGGAVFSVSFDFCFLVAHDV